MERLRRVASAPKRQSELRFDKREFPASHEVYAVLCIGNYLAGLDAFCPSLLPTRVSLCTVPDHAAVYRISNLTQWLHVMAFGTGSTSLKFFRHCRGGDWNRSELLPRARCVRRRRPYLFIYLFDLKRPAPTLHAR
jgi:hypothetical protein